MLRRWALHAKRAACVRGRKACCAKSRALTQTCWRAQPRAARCRARRQGAGCAPPKNERLSQRAVLAARGARPSLVAARRVPARASRRLHSRIHRSQRQQVRDGCRVGWGHVYMGGPCAVPCAWHICSHPPARLTPLILCLGLTCVAWARGSHTSGSKFRGRGRLWTPWSSRATCEAAAQTRCQRRACGWVRSGRRWASRRPHASTGMQPGLALARALPMGRRLGWLLPARGAKRPLH